MSQLLDLLWRWLTGELKPVPVPVRSGRRAGR